MRKLKGGLVYDLASGFEFICMPFKLQRMTNFQAYRINNFSKTCMQEKGSQLKDHIQNIGLYLVLHIYVFIRLYELYISKTIVMTNPFLARRNAAVI